ncbi:hypothetical protein ACSBR2_020440 [Camellia fascicularis]
MCGGYLSAPITDNWKEGTDCCAWDGVTWDNTTSHVIGLDLNCKCLYGTIHPNSSLFNLVHLQHLDLSDNNFNHSQILSSFGRFTNLTHLHLSDSYLSGPIQSSEEEVWQGNNFSNSIFHLQKLQELSLQGNRELTGKLPSFINGTLRHLRHLRSLDLSETGVTGELPNSIGQLEYLEELYLGGCKFSGTIPRSLGNLTRLIYLHLSFNHFSGKVPSYLSYLENLSEFDLSHNNFEGPIPQLFSNFSQLGFIDFSNNQLTGPIPSSITGLPNLRYLNLGSNSINGTLPSSLFHLVNLSYLDLSSNNLRDTVELDTFAKLDLYYLDLSNNGLSLTTTNTTPYSFRNIFTLRLSSCNINKIPEFLKTPTQSLVVLDLSKNHLNEELNPLCNLYRLQHLDLSNNQFGGLIPTCLGYFSVSLYVLNLQSNNFSGTIPQTFGYAYLLQELDISHNGLHGVLPRSLANCTNLEILNLGHNFIEDAFPFWLENLPQLKIIVLRHNKFHGPIEQPRKRLAFTNLHIIDMSHNEFTGTLPPKYFESMHSMMMDDEDKSLNYISIRFGYYSVTIMNKGLEMKFVRIITILKAVDFSQNKFDGNIPMSIGRLKGLRVLNFSRNSFTGAIPLSLVNLTELESLDLSQNKLSGKIPQELTSLTFLEVFDVSQNNLTGIIPRGKQLETFPNTSYGGNAGLCGFPLSKECKTPKVAESPSLPSSSSHNYKCRLDGFGWEAVLMGYGCGAVFGLVIGSCIIRRKEEWLARIFRVKMRHQKNISNVVRYQYGPR